MRDQDLERLAEKLENFRAMDEQRKQEAIYIMLYAICAKLDVRGEKP